MAGREAVTANCGELAARIAVRAVIGSCRYLRAWRAPPARQGRDVPSRRVVSSPLAGAPEARESAAKRGYGRAWRVAARAYLDEHPLCRECEREGRTEASSQVDHVVPHRGDMGIFWDRANWQPLCDACHARKTRSGR